MDKPKRLYTWDNNTGSYILYDKQQTEINKLKQTIRDIREECLDDETIGYHDWIIEQCDKALGE